jgi:kynureninase
MNQAGERVPMTQSIHSASLAKYYADFRVSDRILLTGHSHQAWPDCARESLDEAWRDAAERVDQKWEKAFQKADRVRAAYRTLLGSIDGDITLAPNTHDLLVRLLSAIDWKSRSEILVTDGEFHTVRRQLLRLEEEGVRIHRIPSLPAETLGARLSERIHAKTALVITSTVFFDSGQRAEGLPQLAKAAQAQGALLLLDTYHHLNVVPFDPLGLESTYIIGGGYKYCQFGEGNCFLRVPIDCTLRPVVTGWFADFESLEGPASDRVQYGTHAGARFAGATTDPISQYRAARVAEFFEAQNLTPERLRLRSQEQISLLVTGFESLDLDPALITRASQVPVSRLAGFLAFKTPQARAFQKELLARGVHTDYRGEILRLGPAPYITDEQLKDALGVLKEVAKNL